MDHVIRVILHVIHVTTEHYMLPNALHAITCM